MMNTRLSVREKIDVIPKLHMSVVPTPIIRLDHLSRELGTNLYCKRDDMTGFAFGGNKIRKLDYLVMDAINQGANAIVTYGAIQSNWCRMTAVAGAVNDLQVYLVLAGKKPGRMTGNLVLDEIAGAHIEYVDTEDENLLKEQAHHRCKRLKKDGLNPYFMDVGGSNVLGSLGYTTAFFEISEYSEQEHMAFSHVFVAAGSAGTQAGMITGQLISGWGGHIVGITVSRSAQEQIHKVRSLVKEMCDWLDFRLTDSIISSHVLCDDRYLGAGYRKNTKDCLQAIEWFARKEGIFLDEVYTGKTAAGLIGYCRNGKFSRDDHILFMHTGGHVQLFE